MRANLAMLILPALCGSNLLAQTLSDAEIQTAIERGESSPTTALFHDVRKKATRITRGDFGAPVELWVAILSDADRIALESAEAKHLLRAFSVDDAKKLMGMTGVLLEARCLTMHAYALQRWTEQGRVHMVLKIRGTNIQPLEKRDEGFSSSFFGMSFGWSSAMTRFTFPELPEGIQSVTVTVIPASGKAKEKQVTVP